MLDQNTSHQSRPVGRGTRALAALAVAAAVTASAALFGACDSSTTEPGSGEVLLGALFPMTGAKAANGVTGKAAMELAIEDVNQQLANNVAGLRFAATVEDTRFEPDAAAEKMRVLQTKGARLVIGPFSSAEVVAVAPIAKANAMLVVSPASTAGSLAIPGDEVFRFTPADSLEGVAIAAMMWDDGVRTLVRLSRADPGNADLSAATVARFTALGGTAIDAGTYAAATTSFSTTVATLRARVDAAIAARQGAGGVAVYLTAFDEVADLFALAAGDPVLASVRWYGSNGSARSALLLGSAPASAFAMRVGFPNPLFGLDEGSRDVWAPLSERIRARTSLDPDAYALAVYDAVWVAAKAYLAVGATPGIEALKQSFVATAATHFGATSWTTLNAAGDRAVGNYDFWAIREVSGTPRWTRVAHYDTRTGALFR
jgi:branched-chain amino acid transport system substrate-binding protein